jgi:hypothetical protein
MEPAFQTSSHIAFAGESFEEGYWLVKIKWLEFVSVNSAKQRRYRLGEEHMISVHLLVRFRALALSEPVVAAAAPRGRGRPAAAESAPPLKLFLQTTDECAKIVGHTENRRKIDGTTRGILQSKWLL